MALAASRCEPVGSNTARGPHWCGCLANTHPSRTTGLQRLRATVAISGSRHVIHQEPRRAANGLAVLLLAVLSAAGVAFGLSRVDTPDEAAQQATTIGLTGGIALLVVVFLAYLARGYVAGRMARFDGARQGLAVWLIGLLVVVVLGLLGVVLGGQYNVLSQLNLPSIPVSGSTATTAGVVAGVAAALVSLLGALLGGGLGTRYHRKIDRVGFTA